MVSDMFFACLFVGIIVSSGFLGGVLAHFVFKYFFHKL